MTVEDPISSQFATGLLLALPLACEETTIRVARPIATPYLDMTIDTARQFGIEILHKDYQEFYIAGGQYYSPTEEGLEGRFKVRLQEIKEWKSAHKQPQHK